MSGELGSGARTPVRGDLCPKCEYGTLDKVSYCNGHGYQQPGVLPGQSRGQCIHRHQGDHLLIQCLTCGFGIVEPCHDDPSYVRPEPLKIEQPPARLLTERQEGDETEA